jgi:hypothetical protein
MRDSVAVAVAVPWGKGGNNSASDGLLTGKRLLGGGRPGGRGCLLVQNFHLTLL